MHVVLNNNGANSHEENGDSVLHSFVENTAPGDASSCKYIGRRKCYVQFLLATAVTLSAATTGMAMGYSAVLLPQLNSTNDSLKIDEEMGSWIASINFAATPLGSILSGIMIDCWGRRLSLQIQAGVVIIGWTFIASAQNHALILVGRFFAGVATGIGVVAGQVYIGEVTEPHMRAVMSSIPFASIALGILVIYALGSTMHWRLVAGISITVPVAAAVLYFALPESPVWLVRRGHNEKAKKAYIWFRGHDILQAKQELQQLINRVENESFQKKRNSQSPWASFCTPAVLKPLLIANLFNFLQTFAGVYLFVFYAVEIISLIGEIRINDFFAAVLTAGIRFVLTIAACVLLAYVGRRTIALLSGIGTAISALALASALQFNYDASGYFPGLCLLFYIAANTIGLLVLPGIMMGELFPARARATAGSLTYTMFSIFTFAIAKVFPLLKRLLDINGFFWLFGISSLLICAQVYLMLPETKGKTLNEIEDYFLQDNIFWVNRVKKCKSVCPSQADDIKV